MTVNDFDPTTPADTIRSFENAIGTGARDFIYGTSGQNTINGGGGNDYLYGLGGRDLLTGGLGADRFVFLNLNDSKAGQANRDVINDFQHGSDLMDLYSVDANSRAAGNQMFKFIGTQAFHKVAGELHYQDLGATCLVQGDVNGDGKADFEILVRASTLSAGDFVL
jgi:Ca2+-binding RTX toxin-like protein